MNKQIINYPACLHRNGGTPHRLNRFNADSLDESQKR